MSSTPLIKLEHAEQQYVSGDENLTVLHPTTFEVQENTFTIIYGPSGSGKSTLLNILSGLQPPTKGKLIIESVDIYKLSPNDLAYFRANKVGIVYQTNYWVKSLSVLENVSVPLYFLGYSRSKAAVIAMQALERVDMARYAHKNPVLLSGGEQQRIAMARALANDPLIIIADEPTGSLDSKNGTKIMNTLRQSQDEYKRTVVLVTHNMEYLPLADNLLNIEDGVVKVLPSTSIQKTTDELMQAMKDRIDAIAKARHEK